jgi:hypothetical protein
LTRGSSLSRALRVPRPRLRPVLPRSRECSASTPEGSSSGLLPRPRQQLLRRVRRVTCSPQGHHRRARLAASARGFLLLHLRGRARAGHAQHWTRGSTKPAGVSCPSAFRTTARDALLRPRPPYRARLHSNLRPRPAARAPAPAARELPCSLCTFKPSSTSASAPARFPAASSAALSRRHLTTRHLKRPPRMHFY